MSERLSRPPLSYYDDPTIPVFSEADQWESLPLSPLEAHHALINAINNKQKLSASEEKALVKIIEGRCDRNFYEVLNEVDRDLDADYHD